MARKCNREKWLSFWWYSGLFFVLFGVVVLFHAVNGRSLIYNVDAPGQDYPTFLYLGKLLRHFFSTGSLRLYDFSIGLGSDVISPLNFNGFGDPVNLISVFAVGKWAVYLYESTLILRLYLCGIAMLLFCRKHGKEAGLSVLAAVLYVFSAFALPNGLQFYQILNAAYIFPLLLIQVEELIRHEENMRRGGVKLSLLIALQACCSFYFLYIQTILIFFYALVEYFCLYPGDFRHIFKKAGLVSRYYFLGILTSGVILFPAVRGLLLSARMETGIIGGPYLYWSAQELLLKLENLFVHKKSAMFAVSLGISFISFLAVMRCWFSSRKKERVFSVLLTAAYASPFVWSMMNGFSYPNTRWVYAVYFGIAYATILLLGDDEEKTGKKGMAAAIAVFICSMGYHYMVQQDKIRTAACVGVTAFGLWTLFSGGERRRKRLMAALLANLLLNMVFLEGPYQICGQELYLSFMPRAEMEAVAQTVEEKTPADEWCRTDRAENANQGALLQGYQGCWGYYSIINGNIWSFYDALKISPAMRTINYLGGLDGRQAPESLLSVKYVEKDGKMEENAFWLPLGVEYTSALAEETFRRMTPLERQDAMTRGLVLENPQGSLLSEEEAAGDAVTALCRETEYVNVTEENGRLTAGKDAKIIVHIKEDLSAFDFETGELYLYLEGMWIEGRGEGEVSVDGKTLAVHDPADIYTTGQKDQLVKIEKAGQDIVMELAEDTAYHIDRVSVYWYETGQAREALSVLQRHGLIDLQYGDNWLEGDIDASGGWLFLSIPFDRGWKVYVDQERVSTQRANIGFTAVKLPEGRHHVRMVYEPLQMKMGLLATLLGILLTGAEWLRTGGGLRVQRKKQEDLP